VVKLLGGHFYELSFGKRLPDELYRITDDPECIRNLAHDLAFKDILEELRYKMMSALKEEGDPRALGKGDEVFDTYQYTAGRGKGYETWLASQEAGPLAELNKKLESAKSSKAAKGKKAKAEKK
jgi:N-sulfoglucosamine sulfohydrolase